MTILTRFEQSVFPANASSVQVASSRGHTRELSQVQIGRNFVFGLLEDNQSWCLFRLSAIWSFRFLAQENVSLPKVRWTRKTATELINCLNLPAPAVIEFPSDPDLSFQLMLLGTAKAMIATDSIQHPYIPLTAISYLEIASC